MIKSTTHVQRNNQYEKKYGPEEERDLKFSRHHVFRMLKMVGDLCFINRIHLINDWPL